MDLGKMFSLALLPAAILVIVSLALTGLMLATGTMNKPGENSLATSGLVCLIVPISYIFYIAVLGWSGYNAVKNGLDILGGAVTGAFAGVFSTIVNTLAGIALLPLTTGANAGTAAGTVGIAAYIFMMVVSAILSVGFWAVAGAVCGAGGAFVAQRK